MNPVDFVVNQLKKRNPQAIVLFGSHAWGTPTKDSDVDVLVVEETNKSRLDQMRELRKSIGGNVAVDVVALKPSELAKARQFSFYRQILNEGKVLYGGL